jgi:hypothetical protein
MGIFLEEKSLENSASITKMVITLKVTLLTVKNQVLVK